MKPYFCLAVVLCVFLAQPPTAPAASTAELSSGSVVYVIPIKGMIERALVYAIRRGVDEAVEKKADAIIFDMDTPGGRLDATEEIISIITGLNIKTYTFVNPNAISAGAIISMATDHIYMAPGGRIGDAMPIMMSPLPMGGVEAMPSDIKEKAVSPTEALIRSAAQRKKHDPDLASAMVRLEVGYTNGTKVICEKGRLLTLTAQDAEQLVGEGDAKRPLLSEGTVKDMNELLEKIGHPKAQVQTITITSAEQIARVIDGFPWSGIILAAGLLALYLEFKTPGVILPGVIGVILLAIWFWGHRIAGLAGMGDILLFLIGMILVFVEVVFVPSMGILGVIGAGCMVLALFLAMMGHFPDRPWYQPPDWQLNENLKNLGLAFVIAGIMAAIAARFLPKTQLFHHLVLDAEMNKEKGFQSASASEAKSLVGLKGKAETFLRPAGIGVFGDKRLDVVTRDGQYLPKDTPIIIAEAHGNRIVVEAVSNTGTSNQGKS
jgi:membrane-bound serine protease (ClpP class)